MRCVLFVSVLLGLGACTGAHAWETGRIVGGEESLPGEWPFMVALIRAGHDPEAGQFCGGSLVAARWVLTAAHCVIDRAPDDIELIIGAHDLASADDAIFANVTNIEVHPDFDDGAPFDSDLALLELQQAVDWPSLQSLDAISMDQLSPGTSLTVAGWGNRSSSGQDFSPLLHHVHVPLVDDGVCQASYDDISVAITDRMLCAGFQSGGKDACSGDSGGPLMVNANGGWRQVGIVSFGEGCALPDFYGVYTKVADFQSWLRGHTEGVTIAPERDFGALPPAAEQSSTFTLINNDSVPIALYNARIAGHDASSFRVDWDGCSDVVLAAGTACEIDVTVSADEARLHEALLRVDTDPHIAEPLESRLTALVLGPVDFQTALESPELSWFTGGSVGWDLEPNTNVVGGLSIRSGAIGHGEESIAMSEVEGPGILSFHWKVSSEDNADQLEFHLDGQRYAFVDGELDWTPLSVTIPAGTHRLLWRYTKDAAGVAGEDTGFLDQVTMTASSSDGDDDEPQAIADSGGGGGGTGMWSVVLLALAFARRSSVEQPFRYRSYLRLERE